MGACTEERQGESDSAARDISESNGEELRTKISNSRSSSSTGGGSSRGGGGGGRVVVSVPQESVSVFYVFLRCFIMYHICYIL